MANPELASITCEGCQNPASIKKLNNSNYLYLHCKKCGMDRRTGDDLQAKWQAAIDQARPEIKPVIASITDNSTNEWVPKMPENSALEESDDLDTDDRLSGKSIAAGTIGFLSVLVMIFKAVKG